MNHIILFVTVIESLLMCREVAPSLLFAFALMAICTIVHASYIDARKEGQLEPASATSWFVSRRALLQQQVSF